MQSWKKGIFIGLFSSLLWEQHAVEASIGVKNLDGTAYATVATPSVPPLVTANKQVQRVQQVQRGKAESSRAKPLLESLEDVGSQHRLLAERLQVIEAERQAAERVTAREQAALASRGEVTTAYVPKRQQEAQQAFSNAAPTLMQSTGVSATLGNRAVTIALQYQGVAYRYGGTTPSGFDCSGFIQYVMKQMGVSVPRTTYQQIAAGTPVAKENLRPGDVIFFSCGGQATSHSGMYVGNGKFIHADLNRGVTVADLNSSYWSGVYQAAVRVN
ncbi:MAG: C40 family peptidase [Tumebacillaceae bacterium]